MSRTILDQWDWRYRVGFDAALYQCIERSLAMSPTRPEADLLREQLQAFASFVSLDALADRCAQGDDSALTAALTGMRQMDERALLHVPEVAIPSVTRHIARCRDLGYVAVASSLEELLTRAISIPYRSLDRELFECIFAGDLDELLAYGARQRNSSTSTGQISDKPDQIRPELLPDFVTNTAHELRERADVRRLFPNATLPDFDLSIVQGSGFAEYWPIALTPGSTRDRLIVFVNDDSLNRGDLYATIAHEVFPGHGYFYARVAESSAKLVDMGAFCLIEGWATWSEWVAISDADAKRARALRVGSLPWFGGDLGQLLSGYASHVASFGYSPQLLVDAATTVTQYPGLTWSYTLGALWLERRFEDQSPHEFLMARGARAWGDFFRLW